MRSVARLYKNFQPNHYELTITPDVDSLTFSGHVTIRGKKVGRPSQRLTFHQHELKIKSAKVIRRDKKGIHEHAVVRINKQDTLQEVRLHTGELLYPGDYEVELSFDGVITTHATGLYTSTFTLDGQEHTILVTQLESHYAREIFPSIDEPEAKATFRLTLIAPSDKVVLSNTPVAKQEPVAGQQHLLATTFEATPRMSTYLLAFVVGELNSKTTHTKRGTSVSIWATIAQPTDSLDYALDVARRTIEFFEDYFDVHYPLSKADYVAIPDMGGSTAAMENWGLITYRESTLLAYPGELSQATREYIAIVIAHETAHQWFGNLVTMKWWDNLWLNESFANMMEYRAVDALFPEWHIWSQFVAHEGILALRRDATAGVQAVEVAVHHPTEINAIFDPYIVYAKGGRLLYMLMQYVGEPVFRKGLTAYFKRHAFGNTTGDDLWQALGDVTGLDLVQFMHGWLKRSGFPVVSVSQQGKHVAFSQVHFMENGAADDGQIWPVPLFGSNKQLPQLLARSDSKTTLSSDKFIRINQDFAGHYIVHYTKPEHRAWLESLVHSQELSTPDRLMLLNSASMLTKAGYEPFADVLRLLNAYEGETDEAVWGTMSLIIGECRRFVNWDESLEAPIKVMVRRLIDHEYHRLGWTEKDNESSEDRKLRATIIGLGAYAEQPEVVAHCLNIFDAYLENPATLLTELRSVIFSVAVREKHGNAVEHLLALHDTTSNSELREDIAAGLSATRDTKLAKELLARLLDPKLVRPQDAIHWLVFILRNRHTKQIAWEWLTSHWDWVKYAFGNENAYDDFPRFMASVCDTPEWQRRYKQYFTAKLHEPALQRNIEIGMNEIATRVAWLERDLISVQKFFKG